MIHYNQNNRYEKLTKEDISQKYLTYMTTHIIKLKEGNSLRSYHCLQERSRFHHF
jgi:hypothetical protein